MAALYAAALFIVARIPLSDIFLMATPLHSQNFVDTGQGILTNNRRLVTKNMWFNGTALSAQARRALENERVTLVAHETGYVHILFPQATIAPEAYQRFLGKLRRFLQTPLTPEILGNFVRHSSELQECFQARWRNFGVDHYIAMEKLLAYEYDCPFRFNDDTRERLMMEVAGEDFEAKPLPDRIVLDDLEDLVRQKRVDIRTPGGFALLVEQVAGSCVKAQDAIGRLRDFCWTEPRLPDAATRTFKRDQPPLDLTVDMDRGSIIARLDSLRSANELADLAFYAYRDLNRTEAGPFLKAALERSPVSIAGAAAMDDVSVVAMVEALVDDSIYDELGRLAQPDEVWNYGRGDGAEKALLLANILRARHPEAALTVEVSPDSAVLNLFRHAAERGETPGRADTGDTQGTPTDAVYRFPSRKGLRPQTWRCGA